MEVPKDLLFTLEHEWLRVQGNKGVVGITEFAQDQLGDIVFVELPQVGSPIKQENAFGVVESVKTVSDLYAPVDGKVTATNKDLETNPDWVNSEPYGKGWIIEIEIDDPKKLDHLLAPGKYLEQCQKEQHG